MQYNTINNLSHAYWHTIYCFYILFHAEWILRYYFMFIYVLELVFCEKVLTMSALFHKKTFDGNALNWYQFRQHLPHPENIVGLNTTPSPINRLVSLTYIVLIMYDSGSTISISFRYTLLHIQNEEHRESIVSSFFNHCHFAWVYLLCVCVHICNVMSIVSDNINTHPSVINSINIRSRQ